MLFNSVEFIFIFLPFTLMGCFVLSFNRRLAIGWLIFCSLFYYGWFKVEYLLLISSSIGVNYWCGEQIILARNARKIKIAKICLILGLVFNLGLLGYYKYFNFFVDTTSIITGFSLQVSEVILPIGISFFTFQQIAYLMDCHAGLAHRTRFIEYCLFISYFPQLIAGPIVHPNSILPQIEKNNIFVFCAGRLVEGLTLFILGLSKKVLLADQFSIWVAEGFGGVSSGSTLNFLEAWGSVTAYTFQIYFDFSGYSDMAIGLAWMIGIKLPINFKSPYKATSIIDFWRRWHITLSRFLRDYLYIPLGGNRKGARRRWANLFITMLLGGLWHGAGWTFVIWGGLHGLFLAINHAWIELRSRVNLGFQTPKVISCFFGWGITILCVMVAWVFFRADSMSDALSILRSMMGLNEIVLPMDLKRIVPINFSWIQWTTYFEYLGGGTRTGMVEFLGFSLIGSVVALWGKRLDQLKPTTRLILLIPVASLTIQKVLVSNQSSEFIYYQF